ncbi:MAG: hypothetical protein B7Y40_07560 [Gammaproteobacteria bacterium 28-57-27]|nr:MAG: hypothetical protein B7Y40_07560 [Gammaproteobacteria bacterium 28-57-27]
MRHTFRSYTMLLLLTPVFLSGCSFTERFLSSVEKIHLAFPPSTEVRVALEDVRAALKNEPDALKTMEERIRSQIQLRSLTCTLGLSIGLLDSVEKIKALPVKPECLAEQDEALAAVAGTFRLSRLLVQPPLRPLAPLDGAFAFSTMGGLNASSFDAASQANVLLVRGSNSGGVASVEIPSGKTIASMPNIRGDYYYRASVSPNGRVAALSQGNSSVMFVDMERGNKLWETRKFTQFYAWLPDARAIIVREAKSSSPVLLDLETSRLDAYTVVPKNLKWVTPSAEKNTVWLGSEREVFQVEYTRAKDGLQATVTKNFHLSQTRGVTSHPPTLMNQGKTLFFVSNRDFGSLDLETGQETAWNVADFLANHYAKLSETTLLVESYATPDRSDGMKTWVLDLASRTLAPVDTSSTAATPNRLITELSGRAGWIRHGSGTTYMGSAVPAGTPQSLKELSSAFNLERQIAKIEKMERQEQEKAERARLKSQSPEPLFRPAEVVPTTPVYRASPPALSPSAPPRFGLPLNAQVEAVGVYQGTGTSGGVSPEGRKMGTVDVLVRRGTAPVILVLSSYEPVQWKISIDPGAQLAGVLLSGYYPSLVTGAGSALVLQMGRFYAYQRSTREYDALNREVQSWTGGQSIKVFQGQYKGTTYTVGG